MLEEILLLSGNDIPLLSANIAIHQPTIKEIAYIGEESFFLGCQLLNFSKEILREEDRVSLADVDDFDILMSIVIDENLQAINALLILSLIFPTYQIEFQQDGVHLNSEENSSIIDKESYKEFRDILQSMFNLNPDKEKEEYKPHNEAARIIMEKLKKGRDKAAAAKAKAEGKDIDKKLSLFSRYVSILAVGLGISMDTLLNHTVYQLFDLFKRFQLKQAFDINLQARMAGATGLEEVDNWMEDIHS